MNSLLSRIANDMPRLHKQLLMVLADFVLLVFAVWAAYSLRLTMWFVPDTQQWVVMLAAPVFAIPMFIRVGLYRSVIRYVGEKALMAVFRGMTYAMVLWALFLLYAGISGFERVPRSLPIIYWFVGIFLVGGVRFFARWLLSVPMRKTTKSKQVLIYGANAAGRELASSLKQSHGLFPIGFIDDNTALKGRDVDGIRVYPPSELARLVDDFAVSDLIITESATTNAKRKEIIAGLQHKAVNVRVLPAVTEIASGRVLLKALRDLDIADLLGRDAVPPNAALTPKTIAGKVVLVTGAGGSIGAELCRQIIASKPTTLLLFENSEFNLYSIHAELEKMESNVTLVPLMGSVCDAERMAEIFTKYTPHTVYHAAAYKHVPLVEVNPAEGVRNNVFGTLTVAQAARAHGVADFVLISTDKAVRPTNVMGASKRVAELVLQAMAAEGGATRFSMVRFGNVLGSSGSVVPLFRKQIKEGGPITLTHEDVVRYFMTIPEAAQLVIQAAAMAEGGDVFVLDMGEPVKIKDLARRMVELSGKTVRDNENPDGDIEIAITGLRPGEKLYEELLIGNNPQPTEHLRILKAHEAFTAWSELKVVLSALQVAIETNDEATIRQLLKTTVFGA